MAERKNVLFICLHPISGKDREMYPIPLVCALTCPFWAITHLFISVNTHTNIIGSKYKQYTTLPGQKLLLYVCETNFCVGCLKPLLPDPVGYTKETNDKQPCSTTILTKNLIHMGIWPSLHFITRVEADSHGPNPEIGP